MKKILSLLAFCMFAIAAKASITIYVKCNTAPFIWSWSASDGVDYNVGSWPGTNRLTQTYYHSATGETFWTYTFPETVTSVSFLFNNGYSEGTKQTGDQKGITSDHWYYLSWDDGSGNVDFRDVTEDYGVEIPDAEVNSVTLVGNHNNWGETPGEPNLFTEVVDGQTFRITLDTKLYSIDENLWRFKFRPNGTEWVGYNDVTFDGDVPSWIDSDISGNFTINLDDIDSRVLTLTVTWGGGKYAYDNWIFKAETVKCPSVNFSSTCTDGERYYSTYSSSNPFVVPTDLTVSEIKVEDDKLELSTYSTGDVVPANTGVLVSSLTAGVHSISASVGGTSKLGSENMLKPTGDNGISHEDMDEADTKFYRLTMHDGTRLGFWWGFVNGAAFNMGANKAYLAVPDGVLAREGFFFDDGEATSLREMNNENIELRNADWHNLAGQHVAQPTKGIYIVNGKKVIR